MFQRLRARRPRSMIAESTVAAMGLLAGGLQAAAAPATASATAHSVIVVAYSAQNTVAQNFNPFFASSPLGLAGELDIQLIYEPLLQFNLQHPLQVTDWLASAYAWGDGGRSITFTIRKGVKWSNGTPLTAADVAFTYDLIKKFPALNSFGLVLKSVTTSGDTVTLKFPSPQYQLLYNIGEVEIVPKSVWQTIANPVTYTDANPVGTGPYELSSFSSTQVILTKNPNYWQPGEPKIDEVDNPIYSSNTTLEEALVSNQVDWSGDFIPGVNKIYVGGSPYHHAWEPPVYANELVPNLTKWPTNVLAVRQAISLAVDRQKMSSEGESGQSPPVTTATGLLPQFQPFYTTDATLTRNVAEARSILEKAGFVMGSDGYFHLHSKTGQLLSFEIIDPESFSDWDADGAIDVAALKQAGIDATYTGLSVSGWSADIAQGDFTLSQEFGAPSISPYAQYQQWLDSAESAPIGKTAIGDWERLYSPAMDNDLSMLASANTVAAEKAALAPMEKFVVTQLPVIPTIYDSDFDDFNTQSFTGFPTPQNPYEMGNPVDNSYEVVFLHLRPRS